MRKKKQVYGYCKCMDTVPERETSKEKLNLLIQAQNNVIRTNYINAKTDAMQKKSKSWLSEERDETVNHIKCQCIRLVKK